MQTIASKIETIVEVVLYSLLQWVLGSGSFSNPGSFLGFFFFSLSMYLYIDFYMKTSEKFKERKSIIVLLMILYIVLTLSYAYCWGYFDIQLLPLSLG
ncbi:MAG TPA: hypothetical protein VLM88_02095 [Proteiniclasticum sp.]|nr:hypothetical protein [Proteiniclasticum sp.]